MYKICIIIFFIICVNLINFKSLQLASQFINTDEAELNLEPDPATTKNNDNSETKEETSEPQDFQKLIQKLLSIEQFKKLQSVRDHTERAVSFFSCVTHWSEIFHLRNVQDCLSKQQQTSQVF